MPLIKSSPTPLYTQLGEQLRQQVENELQAGDRIPSVRELSERYGISPMTVRQALSQLVNEGLLEIRRGIGTFVARPKISYDLAVLSGFTEDMSSIGLTPRSELLSLEVMEAPDRIARALGLAPAAPVVHVARLRSSGDTPTVLDESFLPHALCAGLEHEDLAAQSLYGLLEGRYGLFLDHATQVMESTSASAFEAQMLGISLHAPVFLIRGVTYLSDSRPIEYFKAVYRGDRYKFKLETVRLRRRE